MMTPLVSSMCPVGKECFQKILAPLVAVHHTARIIGIVSIAKVFQSNPNFLKKIYPIFQECFDSEPNITYMPV